MNKQFLLIILLILILVIMCYDCIISELFTDYNITSSSIMTNQVNQVNQVNTINDIEIGTVKPSSSSRYSPIGNNGLVYSPSVFSVSTNN